MKPESQKGAIERSYQLLALLEVCRHSADHIESVSEPGPACAAAGELEMTLKLAVEIAGEVHDFLETGKIPKENARD